MQCHSLNGTLIISFIKQPCTSTQSIERSGNCAYSESSSSMAAMIYDSWWWLRRHGAYEWVVMSCGCWMTVPLQCCNCICKILSCIRICNYQCIRKSATKYFGSSLTWSILHFSKNHVHWWWQAFSRVYITRRRKHSETGKCCNLQQPCSWTSLRAMLFECAHTVWVVYNYQLAFIQWQMIQIISNLFCSNLAPLW